MESGGGVRSQISSVILWWNNYSTKTLWSVKIQVTDIRWRLWLGGGASSFCIWNSLESRPYHFVSIYFWRCSGDSIACDFAKFVNSSSHNSLFVGPLAIDVKMMGRKFGRQRHRNECARADIRCRENRLLYSCLLDGSSGLSLDRTLFKRHSASVIVRRYRPPLSSVAF